MQHCLAPCRFLFFGLLALVLARAGAGEGQPFAARLHTNAAGETMPYRLLVPSGYDSAKKYPLVLFFHGAGERGTDNQRQLTHGTSLFTQPKVRQTHPCFVVAPQCPTNQQWVDMPWNTDAGTRPAQPSGAMQRALEILETVSAEFSIDPRRVYVTGLSMGGFGTWDCLTRSPERFAAGAPVCGGGDEKTITSAVAQVPVWAFHSEDDPMVKVGRTRGMVEAMRAAGGRPHYTEYTDLGHGCWEAAYREPRLLPWLFAQRSGRPDTFALNLPPASVTRFPADDAFPGEGPIRKMDWFRRLYVQRRTQWWYEREQDRGAVVFLGDSITQGWASLAKDFPDLKVANRGISGDTTRGVLYRLQEDVLALKPAAVVLLIGTNDLEEQAEPETIAGNVRAMLEAFRKHQPEMPVVVCRVMPSDASKKRPVEKIRRLNALLDELTKSGRRWASCDTYSLFADPAGNATPEFFPDLLHPNVRGYAKWAEQLRPVLAGLDLAPVRR